MPLLLVTALKEGLHLSYFDIEQAFGRSGIDADICLRLPPGRGSLSQKLVGLKKTIYALKQANTKWIVLMFSQIESFGFEQSLSDPCVYRLFEKGSNTGLKVIVTAWRLHRCWKGE